ncbi:uncharacterized protein LOC132402390 [Hypanus sabinus]|uniref:uncharacterized protein LOC132402390 n=1 Tax=Hypanus sabinus TaxID=79690 RepID=UPI0028C508CE|nr:uncharacterized protein LOC132402390 [Hypanus sabinus]
MHKHKPHVPPVHGRFSIASPHRRGSFSGTGPGPARRVCIRSSQAPAPRSLHGHTQPPYRSPSIGRSSWHWRGTERRGPPPRMIDSSSPRSAPPRSRLNERTAAERSPVSFRVSQFPPLAWQRAAAPSSAALFLCGARNLVTTRKMPGEISRPGMEVRLSAPQACIESILSSCITAWFGNCTISDCKTLQRIVRSAEKIIRVSLPAIMDIYTTHCINKANSIMKEPTHPSYKLFALPPSGKRHRSIRALTTRLCNSFFPQAIRLLNTQSLV